MRASRRASPAERAARPPRQGSPQLVDRSGGRERALLVAADWDDGDAMDADESVAELGRLAQTAGLEIVAKVVQTVKRVHPATFVGTGKVEEIRELAETVCASVAIFDDQLSPAQQRNLSAALKIKAIARNILVTPRTVS